MSQTARFIYKPNRSGLSLVKPFITQYSPNLLKNVVSCKVILWQGDSGGPATAKVGDRYELWGIVSYGPKPCDTKAYSVYATVYAVRGWLHRVAGGPCPSY